MKRMRAPANFIIHKKKINTFLLILLLVHILFSSIAQVSGTDEKYRAVHWGFDDGLTIETLHRIIKDINGFIWLGSSHGELCRFDGNKVRHYYPDKSKPGSIRNINCISFVEDSLHNIWIGTLKGLSRYDIRADTFTNLIPFLDSINDQTLVFPFWSNREEVFCLEHGRIITSYDTRTLTRKVLIQIKDEDQEDFSAFNLLNIVYDSTTHSVYGLPRKKEGLLQYSLLTGDVILHQRPDYWNHPKPNVWNDSYAMRYDKKRNSIWINSHDGLFQFTLQDQKFQRIEAYVPFIQKDRFRCQGIDIDRMGRIWLSTMPAGIVIYDPAANRVFSPLADTALRTKVGDVNLKIFCDRDGIVWTSYYWIKGIYQLIPFTPAVKRYTANKNQENSLRSLGVANMAIGAPGEVWIGTGKQGLNIFNSKTNSFKVWTKKDIPGIVIPKTNEFNIMGIVPMVINMDKKKALINAFLPDLVYEMDLLSQTCRYIQFKDSAGRNLIPTNIQNSTAVATNNGYLFVDDLDIFELTRDSLFARRVIVPNKKSIVRMFLGEGEKLFIRTPVSNYNQTYIHINNSWVETPHLLDSLAWSDIFYDRQDCTYWVGMVNELRQYNIDFHLIRRYTDTEEKMGVPWTVIPDGKGNVWFNNDRKAIGKINIITGNITYLSDQDGYTPQSFEGNTPRGIKQGGELYFVGSFADVGNTGFDQISLDKLVNTPPPKVYINSFKINKNQSSKAINVNELKDITLQYNENKLTIETGVIDYYSHRDNKIRFKLERNGSEAGWEYAPADYTIRYEELPPGKYSFQIQASNASNDYQGQLKTLNIIIKKAWWNTWIIRIVSVVLIISLVVLIMYVWFQYNFRQKLKVELLRQKIAADLHDEIGSNLSSMTFSAELMKKKLVGTNQDIESILNNLVTNSRETSTLISDTIWSLNPKNDSFEKLIGRMETFTHDMFSLKDIQYQFNSNGHVREPILSLEQKRNIYLIYKEAINNIVKHSNANNVNIRIEPLQDNLDIEIKDDGIGFDMSEIYQGNGLTNFKTRSRKGFCEVHYSSKIGLGTTVKITVPIKPKEQNTNGISLTNEKSK